MGETPLVKLRYTLPALADPSVQSSIISRLTRHKGRGASMPAFTRSSIFCCFIPDIGTRTDDPSIRRMTALPYPYLIFYEATETEIIIHAVRHAARDPSSMPGAS